MEYTPPQDKRFYLFGFPISFSKAPALHNAWFQSWPSKEASSSNTYALWETAQITKEVLDVIKSDECGGAAVTMPLKAAIMPFLDEISEESRATGACNTIAKVPIPSANGVVPSFRYKLVGTNTDIVGIRNALLMALSSQYPSSSVFPFGHVTAHKFPPNFSAVLIGGGATTRSAAYALASLGLHTLYIVNRDADEVRSFMRDMTDKEGMRAVVIVWLKKVADVKEILGGKLSKRLILGVGAIPSAQPSTPAERTVYEIAKAVFSLHFDPPTSASESANDPGDDTLKLTQDTFLPIPQKRLFLDMCYTPSPLTPLLNLANSLGWHAIDGVKATIEQGKAQQRMWFSGNTNILQSRDRSPLE